MFYSIMKGQLSLDSGVLVGTGYSGYGVHKNNPNSCKLKNLGPIPCGKYSIVNAPGDKRLGKMLLKLQPYAANQMYGRSGFYIHGEDSNPLTEDSHGCIVMSYSVRLFLNAASDRILTVIP